MNQYTKQPDDNVTHGKRVKWCRNHRAACIEAHKAVCDMWQMVGNARREAKQR